MTEYVTRTTLKDLETEETDVDKWGIRKLYKGAIGDNAQEWFFDMENPTSDSRLKNLKRANLRKVDDDGSWSVDGTANDGNGQVRLEAWSKSTNNKWLNTEVTVYGLYIRDLPDNKYDQSTTAFQLYSGGGHHSPGKPCDAGCYKIRLWKDGKVAVRKEPMHPFFCEDRGKIKATDKGVKGRWIGLKQVRYNFQDDNKVFVANEIWIDDDSDHDGKLEVSNQWRRVSNVIDKGGWGLPNDWSNDKKNKYIKKNWHDDCPCMDQNVNNREQREIEDVINIQGGTNEGNLAALRCDGIKLKFKYFSVREVTPPRPD